ncbi:hypothetical protein L798_14496 [Zootermopsis nevadensis]|uniref:Uncharacterized protein n=1 Tax=Zootermopsis nevadensis TaxID=136037 RepID=A0A067RKR9_ZOONE|nr:hypothetical protein L798_14496 [Zootermopsis nevadensis]
MATGHTKDAVQRTQKSDSGKRTEIPPLQERVTGRAQASKTSTCYVADGTRTILIHLHKVYLTQEAVEESRLAGGFFALEFLYRGSNIKRQARTGQKDSQKPKTTDAVIQQTSPTLYLEP